MDLSSIEVPLLNIAGEKDFICPPGQSRTTMDVVGSREEEFFALDAGHLGLIASREARERLWPRTGDWLREHSR